MTTGNPPLDLSLLLAGLVVAAAFTTWAIVRLEAWAYRSRQRPRFEASRRLAAAVEDDRDDTADLTPILDAVCPGCGRNAGHNAGCPEVGGLGLRAQSIEVPREGETL